MTQACNPSTQEEDEEFESNLGYVSISTGENEGVNKSYKE